MSDEDDAGKVRRLEQEAAQHGYVPRNDGTASGDTASGRINALEQWARREGIELPADGTASGGTISGRVNRLRNSLSNKPHR